MFDLEKVTFGENVPKLFSQAIDQFRWDDSEGIDYSELKYYPYDHSQIVAEIEPAAQYGYRLESREMADIAIFDSIRFYRMEVLTDIDTAAVAFFCRGKYADEAQRDRVVELVIEKYGPAPHTYELNIACYHTAYCWELEDRILQIDTDFGRSVSISTDSPEPIEEEYYTIELLIAKKDAITELAEQKKLTIEGRTYFVGSKFIPNILDPEEQSDQQIQEIYNSFF